MLRFIYFAPSLAAGTSNVCVGAIADSEGRDAGSAGTAAGAGGAASDWYDCCGCDCGCGNGSGCGCGCGTKL